MKKMTKLRERTCVAIAQSLVAATVAADNTARNEDTLNSRGTRGMMWHRRTVLAALFMVLPAVAAAADPAKPVFQSARPVWLAGREVEMHLAVGFHAAIPPARPSLPHSSSPVPPSTEPG